MRRHALRLCLLAVGSASALHHSPPPLFNPAPPPSRHPRNLRPVIASEAPRSQSPPAGAAVQPLQAVLALNAATLIWGSQHAIIKDVVEAASPASVNAARFAIAAAASVPWLPGAPWRRDDALDADGAPADSARIARTWAAGAELGGWTFAGFALQAVGLQFTTASRSAFLLYLNVKLVPLLALLLYGRRSSGRTWASAAVAFAGTALLSFDGSPPNIGDGWSLAAALASACFILRLEEANREGEEGCEEGEEGSCEALALEDSVTRSGEGSGEESAAAARTRPYPAELNAATISCAALFTSLWAAGELLAASAPTAASPLASVAADGAAAAALSGAAERAAELGGALSDHLPALLYLAIVTTAVAQWLQAVGQSRVGAQDAAIIYALDPVYGAGFSWLLLGEQLGPRGFAGGGLVLAAVALSRTAPPEERGAGERERAAEQAEAEAEAEARPPA